MKVICVMLFLTMPLLAQDTVKSALPWPAPELLTGLSDHDASPAKMDAAKTFYLQSSLKPDEATPAKWITDKYALASPDTADLRIFTRSHPETEEKVDAWGSIAWGVAKSDYVQVTRYEVAVFDSKGVPVMQAFGNSPTQMWNNLLVRIDYLKEDARKKEKKAAKQKK